MTKETEKDLQKRQEKSKRECKKNNSESYVNVKERHLFEKIKKPY